MFEQLVNTIFKFMAFLDEICSKILDLSFSWSITVMFIGSSEVFAKIGLFESECSREVDGFDDMARAICSPIRFLLPTNLPRIL